MNEVNGTTQPKLRVIDSHAVVSLKATIGNGVRIDAFAVIEDDVVIGDDCWIGANAVIANGTRMGKENRIFPMASIGNEPQDLKYHGEPTTLEMGDRNVVREFVTLNRGTSETARTIIQNDCLFMAYAHVGHDCRVGNRVILANNVALGGHVHINDWAIIGGGTPVHQFCKIGEHAMIGGGFRVVKDVPPFILAGQEPLVFEGLNSIGLRRRGFEPDVIATLERAYEILYRSNLNVSQAVAKIKEQVPMIPVVESLLGFIGRSKRGIISGRARH